MIEQQGRIIRAEAGQARISIGPREGCTACAAGQGCGAGIFGRLLRRRPIELSLDNPDDWPVGRAVTVGVPEAVFLRLVMRLYALPLLAGLAGAVVCHHISQIFGFGRGGSDLLTLAGLLLGAAVALNWRAKPRSLEGLGQEVRLLGKVDEGGCAVSGARADTEF